MSREDGRNIGITLHIERELPPAIRIVDGETETAIIPVDQRVGRELLRELVKGKVLLSGVSPVYVTDLRKRKHNPSVTFYVSSDISGITFSPKVAEAYNEHGAILLIPQQDNRFGYQWLDVFPVEGNTIHANKKLGSIRVNTSLVTFDSQGWYGPERQAFIDYATNKLQIEDPNSLLSFVVPNSGNGAYIGKADGLEISVNFKRNFHIDRFLIIPQYDSKLKYFWVEGYDANDIDEKNKLFTRRMIRDEKSNGKVRFIEWKGPQIQSVIDWIHKRIEKVDTQEAEVLIDQKITGNNIVLESSDTGDLILRLNNNKSFDRSKPVYLIAREKGIYRWIEVQQKINGSDARRTCTLVRVEIDDKGNLVLNGGWQGSERQAVSDYIDGKVQASQLERLRVKLDANRLAYVITYKRADLRIALRSSIFKEGDSVILTPVIDEYGNLVFEVTKPENPDVVLARSVFCRDTASFKTTSLEISLSTSRKPLGYWTTDKIRGIASRISEAHGDLTQDLANAEEPGFGAVVTNTYPSGFIGLRRDLGFIQANESGTVNVDGKVWASTYVIAKATGISVGWAIRLLSKSPSEEREGRGFNGKKVNFYDFEESVNFIRENIKGKKDKVKSSLPSPDEANKELMRFLEPTEEK